MTTNSLPGSNGSPSVTELVSGIVGDFQDLGMQHLALFRHEIKEDLRRATDALSSLAMGLAVAQLGGIALCLMLAHLLSDLAPNLPIWVCYGIVGSVTAGLGGVGIAMGIKKLRNIDTLSRQAAQIVKDDAQWLTNSK